MAYSAVPNDGGGIRRKGAAGLDQPIVRCCALAPIPPYDVGADPVGRNSQAQAHLHQQQRSLSAWRIPPFPTMAAEYAARAHQDLINRSCVVAPLRLFRPTMLAQIRRTE